MCNRFTKLDREDLVSLLMCLVADYRQDSAGQRGSISHSGYELIRCVLAAEGKLDASGRLTLLSRSDAGHSGPAR